MSPSRKPSSHTPPTYQPPCRTIRRCRVFLKVAAVLSLAWYIIVAAISTNSEAHREQQWSGTRIALHRCVELLCSSRVCSCETIFRSFFSPAESTSKFVGLLGVPSKFMYKTMYTEVSSGKYLLSPRCTLIPQRPQLRS